MINFTAFYVNYEIQITYYYYSVIYTKKRNNNLFFFTKDTQRKQELLKRYQNQVTSQT